MRRQIFVDRYSVEVFAPDGETLLSAAIFLAPESQGLEFYTTDGAAMVIRRELHRLGPARGSLV